MRFGKRSAIKYVTKDTLVAGTIRMDSDFKYYVAAIIFSKSGVVLTCHSRRQQTTHHHHCCQNWYRSEPRIQRTSMLPMTSAEKISWLTELSKSTAFYIISVEIITWAYVKALFCIGYYVGLSQI